MALARVLPFLAWFGQYSKKDLRVDFVSGLTVALVLVPQSMAYAQLAGLPPFYGLYASLFPPIVASLFGSSRQLATGPVAIVSLMTSAALEPLASAGSAEFIAYAVFLALMVGIFQLSLGLLRLGLVVNFLSHPVVNGFTNAAALIIATSQLAKLFGVFVDKGEHHYETVGRIVLAAFHFTHWPTLGMSVLAFGIMYGLKKVNPKIPYVLVAVAVTTVVSWFFHYENVRRVPLSAIHSEAVAGRVHSFNEVQKRLNALGEERRAIQAKIKKATQTGGEETLEYLNLANELEVVSFKTEEAKQEAHVHREELRAILLAEEAGSGSETHYSQPTPVRGRHAERGSRWRLKVGTKALDVSALPLIGGGDVVGEIPQGLPTMSFPQLKLSDLGTLFPTVAIISLLGFMEAISIAKAMAARTGQLLDPNQELIGQGLANIAGSIGQSYPTSGSFSRSAVNLQAGAVSGLSSAFTSLCVLITLLLFTPLLYHLPQATLAAVIMMAVIGLVNIGGFIEAWRTHRSDGVIQVITFVATLAFAPHLDRGIMIGIVLSLGVFLYNNMKPHVAQLSLHPDGAFRDREHWDLQQCRHISMIRFDGPLFFANASYFEDLVSSQEKSLPELRHIILVANGISSMDVSGEDVLALTVDNVRAAGIGFAVSGITEKVHTMMKRTHLLEKIGEENIYPTRLDALEAIYDQAHRRSNERTCPLRSVCHKNEKAGEGEGDVDRKGV